MLEARPNYFYGSRCFHRMILTVTWKLEPLWEKGKSVAHLYIDLFFLQITHFIINHNHIKRFKQPNTKIQVRIVLATKPHGIWVGATSDILFYSWWFGSQMTQMYLLKLDKNLPTTQSDLNKKTRWVAFSMLLVEMFGAKPPKTWVEERKTSML